MTLDEPPTAVFAVNDNTAIGSLAAFAEMGLSVSPDSHTDTDPETNHLITPSRKRHR